MSIIYKITNIITNKCYIGQTNKTFKERWQRHQKDCYRYKYKFAYALRKYKEKDWIQEIIEECNKELLNEREIYWISFYDSFKNGYNSTSGGKHFIHSKETSNKLSKLHKGKLVSDESKKKMSESAKRRVSNRKGVTLTDEQKLKMRLAALGKPKSETHKQNIKNSWIKRKIKSDQ